MEIRHLRYFLAVAEELHFGRAAQKMHIVQSALSMQIKALEDELGGLLFERTSRTVSLTEAGRLFQIEAERAIKQFEYSQTIAKLAISGELGTVRIGVFSSLMINQTFIQCLQYFQKMYPQVKLILNETLPQKAPQALLQNEIDVAYILSDDFNNNFNDKRIKVDGLSQWTYIAVLPHDHALVGAKHLSLEQISRYPFVAYGQIEKVLLEQFRQQINVSHYVTSGMLGVLACVSAGFGVSICPKEVTSFNYENVCYRSISDNSPILYLKQLSRINENSISVLNFLNSVLSIKW
ncbi:hypothetical protein CEP48_00410 [Mergibacter septicus]|uniref:Uncharacterized protein n=1 Tax=Mergibacter septicus TaxID=221402 RepID=A0A8E3MEN5_9PAST|nr:LysR family transcriptional regulator [Mergibacter septicus]AWX14741.1 hypothetical protein CEP47_00410 [Mergibacter septicus]QDJ13992.1 hypothetical protein CEP48_00410 [Mergibacter septicus]UTU48559.1 LysR family transcriptional regulator [Mergibacter septicus]WMR95812.1 LysR family transcriptional regulator [Mergibacter septicus]